PGRALDRVDRAGDRLLRAVAPAAGRRRLRVPPARELLLLADALAALAAELHGRGEELDGLARRALALAAQAEACLEPDEHDRVVWAEPDAVCWAPVDVSRELRERLWDGGPTAILVSATLATGEDTTSSAAAWASTARASSWSARRTTSARRRSSTCPGRCRIPAARASPSASPRRCWPSSPSRPGARSS